MSYIESWVVGFIIAAIVMSIFKLNMKGGIAWLYITLIPYVLGSIVLKLIKYH